MSCGIMKSTYVDSPFGVTVTVKETAKVVEKGLNFAIVNLTLLEGKEAIVYLKEESGDVCLGRLMYPHCLNVMCDYQVPDSFTLSITSPDESSKVAATVYAQEEDAGTYCGESDSDDDYEYAGGSLMSSDDENMLQEDDDDEDLSSTSADMSDSDEDGVPGILIEEIESAKDDDENDDDENHVEPDSQTDESPAKPEARAAAQAKPKPSTAAKKQEDALHAKNTSSKRPTSELPSKKVAKTATKKKAPVVAAGDKSPTTPKAEAKQIDSSDSPANKNKASKPTKKPTTDKVEGKNAEGKPSEGKPSEGKPSEGKPSEGKPSEGKASEGKASEGKASEGKASEAKASEAKASEAKASENKGGAKTGSAEKPEKKDSGFVKKALGGGLAYEILAVGEGPVAASAGKKVSVKYVGTLKTGKKFDSGVISFRVGAGEVVQGFDRGVASMLKGERRRIFIPAKLGYGGQRTGNIPPNSDLIFDITLLNVF